MTRLARAAGGLLLAAGISAGLSACLSGPPPRRYDPNAVGSTRARPEPAPYAIVVDGERRPTAAPVVLFDQPGGYDARRTTPRFSADGAAGLRYAPGRPRGTRSVDKLILHYDVCGLSRECFRVLHDQRKLSVHFLLDVDGTVYQTLDLADTAWHASKANPTSVGVEIAQIGAYPPGDSAVLDEWYRERTDGTWLTIPDRLGDGGVRTEGFRGRAARRGRQMGRINGRMLEQVDFTPEQYDSLAKLTATLLEVFPNLELAVPREPDGSVATGTLPEPAWMAFRGILGHYHVSEAKSDPGPAFDWRAYLRAAALEQLRSGRLD